MRRVSVLFTLLAMLSTTTVSAQSYRNGRRGHRRVDIGRSVNSGAYIAQAITANYKLGRCRNRNDCDGYNQLVYSGELDRLWRYAEWNSGYGVGQYEHFSYGGGSFGAGYLGWNQRDGYRYRQNDTTENILLGANLAVSVANLIVSHRDSNQVEDAVREGTWATQEQTDVLRHNTEITAATYQKTGAVLEELRRQARQQVAPAVVSPAISESPVSKLRTLFNETNCALQVVTNGSTLTMEPKGTLELNRKVTFRARSISGPCNVSFSETPQGNTVIHCN